MFNKTIKNKYNLEFHKIPPILCKINQFKINYLNRFLYWEGGLAWYDTIAQVY